MRLLYPSNLLTKNFSTIGYLNRLGNDNRFSTVTGDPNHLYKNQLFQDINKKPPLIYQKMHKFFLANQQIIWPLSELGNATTIRKATPIFKRIFFAANLSGVFFKLSIHYFLVFDGLEQSSMFQLSRLIAGASYSSLVCFMDQSHSSYVGETIKDEWNFDYFAAFER